MEIKLVDGDAKTPPALFLSESSCELKFSEFTALKATFASLAEHEGSFVFGGLPPRGVCEIGVNGAQTRRTADDDGRLSISVPSHARVTLDATLATYADQR